MSEKTRKKGWTADEIARLGVESDTAIARDLGINKSAVFKQREKLGIAAAKETQKKSPVYAWNAKSEKLLGTMPDSALAKVLGIGTSAARQARQRRGIPPFCASSAKRPEWTARAIKLLGLIPDKEIARLLNCSINAVSKKRRAFKIPSYRSGKSAKSET